MYIHPKKIYTFNDWKNNRRLLCFLIVLLSIFQLVAGCNPIATEQLYQDTESGISLVKPGNWDVAYFERSGVTVLETETEIVTKNSARVEIHGTACIVTPAWFIGPAEELETNIERIRKLYDLDAVSILQTPIEIENGHDQIIKAIIAIPTMSLPEDSVENQVGGRDPVTFQIIELFAIQDNDKFIMVYLYKGNSEELNSEAEKIVSSIKLNCSTEK